MSSTQLLELLHFSSKSSLNRAIRLMFKDEIDDAMLASSINANGTVNEYWLPEIESKMFVAKYDINYLRAITQFWIDRATPKFPEAPKTYSESLFLAAKQQEQIEKQTREIEAKDDLIIVSNEGSIKSGEILIREFCKSIDFIDIGEKKMFTWLKEKKLLSPSNEPYQPYIGRGYFTYKPTKLEHNGQYRYTPRITPRGKIWLAARLLRHYEKNGEI